MKQNRQYRPESWSVQARELADTIFENVIVWGWTVQEGIDFFTVPHRDPLILHRAAKRFGRLVRKAGLK